MGIDGKGTSADFDAFVASRATALLRYGVLLFGNQGDAEDALQDGLEKTWRRWDRLSGAAPEAYVRQCLLNAARDSARRRRVRLNAAARLFTRPPESVTTAVDGRDELLQALGALPPRQRAVLLLRYWLDMAEADVARELGCSVGTVKSQAARGLARLRSTDARLPEATARSTSRTGETA
ncbi:MAG: hypothetical protein JWP11_855 [Frankiales bacterium]|nr:hypothetical protein [Frankiales bacterium]